MDLGAKESGFILMENGEVDFIGLRQRLDEGKGVVKEGRSVPAGGLEVLWEGLQLGKALFEVKFELIEVRVFGLIQQGSDVLEELLELV